MGKPLEYFRWHDAGDIQDFDHLHRIVEVCRATPNTKHWLPTREYLIVRQYLDTFEIPENLTIRVSAPMVDGGIPDWILDSGLTSSTVHDKVDHIGEECKAYERGGECGDCRSCWDPEVGNVSYRKH